MKQIIQNLKNGATSLEEVPCPNVQSDSILIKTSKSLISLGTEKMLVDFSNASYLEKARQQPDKVKMVINKIISDGLIPTVEAVFNKLNTPLPLGYCNVGVVQEVGNNVSEFKVGDRVVSNGSHAEFVCVPKNLVAKIPDNVSDEEAVFTIIGSIGLQGIRLLNPTFGETIVVIGLGLIGLITSDLLKANGCNVIGIDIDENKVNIAKKRGIDAYISNNEGNDENLISSLTSNLGADGVVITASSKSNSIISNAAKITRKKGRIILVGVIGLDISRADFYEKEITFQVSCSYGPGRYDSYYEEKGFDYPPEYVRWTENRNFKAFLNALSKSQIKTEDLITKNLPLENFEEIYNNMDDKNNIATIFEYNKKNTTKKIIQIRENTNQIAFDKIAIIGAGNFTRSTLLPSLAKNNSEIKYIVSNSGLSSTSLAKKFNIQHSATDYNMILEDDEVGLVIITTRHNTHAQIVNDFLKSGKNIFVEKPLALNEDDLDKIVDNYNNSSCSLNVGFNRRFSPFAAKMKSLIDSFGGPINIVATFNAGHIDKNSWINDMEVGGGRIIGEACHHMDLCSFLTNSNINSVCMNALEKSPKVNTDNASILLKYENGSNVVLNYFSNGHKSFSKEKIEVFFDNKILILDNWRKLIGFGFKNFSQYKSKQNKGHEIQFKELINNASLPGKQLISFNSILNTSVASIKCIHSLRENKWVNV